MVVWINNIAYKGHLYNNLLSQLKYVLASLHTELEEYGKAYLIAFTNADV